MTAVYWISVAAAIALSCWDGYRNDCRHLWALVLAWVPLLNAATALLLTAAALHSAAVRRRHRDRKSGGLG